MCPVPGLKRIPDALAAVGTLTTEDYERSLDGYHRSLGPGSTPSTHGAGAKMWQSRCPLGYCRSLP